MFEGYKETKYKCDANKQNIGFGHQIKKDEKFIVINEMEAEKLLENDMKMAYEVIDRSVKVPLNYKQEAA